MAPPVPWDQRDRETITKRAKNLVPFVIQALPLGINAAQLQYRGHAVDRQHIRCDAVVDFV